MFSYHSCQLRNVHEKGQSSSTDTSHNCALDRYLCVLVHIGEERWQQSISCHGHQYSRL